MRFETTVVPRTGCLLSAGVFSCGQNNCVFWPVSTSKQHTVGLFCSTQQQAQLLPCEHSMNMLQVPSKAA